MIGLVEFLTLLASPFAVCWWLSKFDRHDDPHAEYMADTDEALAMVELPEFDAADIARLRAIAAADAEQAR